MIVDAGFVLTNSFNGDSAGNSSCDVPLPGSVVQTHYVLIDLENLPKANLGRLAHAQLKLLVFVGANQPNLPVETVISVQPLGIRAEYIRISGTGPNALDFHIAFYLGKLATEDPLACFYVVSGDHGYDPLIQHLESCRISARRVKSVADIQVAAKQSSVSEIPVTKSSVTEVPVRQVPPAGSLLSPNERLDYLVTRLRQRKDNKPGKIATLKGSIAYWFQRQLPEKEIEKLIQALLARGFVSKSGTKLTYDLPDDA
jgi:hypothetical protein